MQCKEIMIIDGEERLEYVTFSRTVEELLQEKGMGLNEYDKVLPSKEEQISDGDIVVIKRAIPVFNRGRKGAGSLDPFAEAAGLLRNKKSSFLKMTRFPR